MPGRRLAVLSDIDFTLNDTESVSIMGPSGSGKSTFLYILGALEPPTSGSVKLAGRNPYELNEKDLASFRNREIGFVFQDHHLLPQCSVLENVLVPTLVSPPDDSLKQRAMDLLEQVGLADRIHHRPHELSGGEKQRAALARALILRPRLVLCDEPTGNLDHESAETVVSLLFDLHKSRKNMLVVVTHNLEIAGRFGRKFRLGSARLQPA
ncbi:MAG: ABC transporter ATP-binding protein [Acidobacteria bacterium]|nr:ABC transporter ATP-binding protein [Acidobacteriota bacterium]